VQPQSQALAQPWAACRYTITVATSGYLLPLPSHDSSGHGLRSLPTLSFTNVHFSMPNSFNSLLNCQTRNPSRSCISRSTSQSHSLSDSISQRASLFTYHLVRTGYSPVPSSRFTLTTSKTLVSSPTDYASSGSGSEHRIVAYAEIAIGQIPLKSSRTCHRHVTGEELCERQGEAASGD
jgi:hypothetical protein